jgi:hypothetical protein
MRTLCATHNDHGAPYNAGLGFYAFLRFHIDSTKYRRWNMDPAVAAECPPLIHPEDVASVGQPLSPTAAPPAAAPPAAPAATPSTVVAQPLPAPALPTERGQQHQ